MIQLELFCASFDGEPFEEAFEEEEAYHIDDDDGGTESDGDPCGRCDCPRSAHSATGCSPDDGGCGKCRKFVEP